MSDALKTFGTHAGEFPKCVIVDVKGEPIDEELGVIDPFLYESLTLWESIENYFIYGVLVLNDYREFKRKFLNNKGGEFIKIDIFGNYNKANEGEKSITFEIINVEHSQKGLLLEGNDAVSITLAQFPFYRNMLGKSISKGYSNKKVSEITENIFDDFIMKDVEGVESKFKKTETKGKLNSYCIPYKPLYKSINYLKEYAYKSDPSVDAGYYFWADLKGDVNFKPLSDIVNDGKQHKAYISHERELDPKKAEDLTKKYVIAYNSNEIHKELFKEGLTGVSIERYDWFKKKNTWLKVGYKERPNEHEINDYLKPEDNSNFYGKHITSSFRTINSDKNNEFSDCILYNKITKNMMSQQYSEIIINAIPTLGSGDTIEIEREKTPDGGNTLELEGKWFVNGVKHTFISGSDVYNQTLSLGRIKKPNKD